MHRSKGPKDTWHCSVCNFYVFNKKTECKKCYTKKPNTTPYDPSFDKEVCSYFKSVNLDSETACLRCRREGRMFNKDPMKSAHNCWKYS